MADPVEEWRTDQERDGLLPNGIRRRVSEVRRFERHIAPLPLFDAQKHHVNSWIDSVRGSNGQPAAPRTRYIYLSILGCFYKWAILEELTDHNPTDRIKRPKQRRYLPRPMPSSDFEVAMAAAGPRMRAWLCLGALAGLRCMEIAGLDRADVLDGHQPPILVIRGKGGKDRTVPLHPMVLMALQDVGLPAAGPLFTKRSGRRYSPQAVSSELNTYLHGLGITAVAHQLRHKFGTDIYRESDSDLRLTQELMGHESPATTAKYAAWNPVKGAAVVGQLSIRSLSSGQVVT